GVFIMTGEYPVILDGAKAGKLNVSKQGLKYIFDAFCPDTDKLIRLSVYSDSGEGYLGVMQPDNGGMRLHREMSQNALSQFPREIKYAGRSGEKREKQKQPQKPNAAQQKKENDTYWKKDALGMLWSTENGVELCAIPKILKIACYGVELPARTIEGVDYRIFKIEIGKNNFRYSTSEE
ncbi:MAG: hypothetical protein VB071_14220, partial [Lawsonibacter sp.]|nr:hypothetical protein [Lawsonibacter sp.]